MTTKSITAGQQIAAVEQAIRDTKEAYGEERQPMIAALASVAKDIQARRPGAPSVALHELTRRLTAVERSRTALGYSHGAMQGVAEELIGRWAVVKAALELFGALTENEKYALVLRFEDETRRREMIDAIQTAMPGSLYSIPDEFRSQK